MLVERGGSLLGRVNELRANEEGCDQEVSASGSGYGDVVHRNARQRCAAVHVATRRCLLAEPFERNARKQVSATRLHIARHHYVEKAFDVGATASRRAAP